MTITLDGTTGITTPGLTNTGTETLVNLTTTGNTTLGDATTDTLTVGVTGIVKDASGNVGIGTASPAGKLDVYNSTFGGNYTTVYLSSVNSASAKINYAGLGYEVQQGAAGSEAGAMIFRTYGSGALSERARIDSSGNLLVGTTSGGSERLYVTQSANASTAYFLNNNGTATNQYGIVVKLNGDPNNVNHMLQCLGGANLRAEIRSNGGLANYSANNVNLSDRREKTNFAPAGDYLAKICAIPVQTFNYIDQNLEEDDGLTLGVVAQDVQAVAPELVMESNWAKVDEEPKIRLSIYQTDLQYALMKCIQEQQALIQSLTNRISALEAK